MVANGVHLTINEAVGVICEDQKHLAEMEHQINAETTTDVNHPNQQHARLRDAPSLDLNNNSIKLPGVNSNSMNGCDGDGGGIVGRDAPELTRKTTLETSQNFNRQITPDQTHDTRTMSTRSIEIIIDSTCGKSGDQVENTFQITQIDSSFDLQATKVEPERAEDKYGRTKIPPAHTTDESKQYATQAYFEQSDLYSAPAYHVKLKIPEASKDKRKKLQMHPFRNSNTYTYGSGQRGYGSRGRLPSIGKEPTIIALDLSYFTNDRIGNMNETPTNEISVITYNSRLSNATNNTNNTNAANGGNHGKQESRSTTSVPSPNSSDKERRQTMIVYEFDNVLATLSNKNG